MGDVDISRCAKEKGSRGTGRDLAVDMPCCVGFENTFKIQTGDKVELCLLVLGLFVSRLSNYLTVNRQ